MPVWKRFNGKKVTESDANYQKATWIVEFCENGIRVCKALNKRLFTTKKQAEAEENKLRLACMSGESVYLLDKTKLHDFIDDTYLPHAKNFNVNYKGKIIETNHIKQFFPNLELKQINVAWVQKFQNHLKTKIKPCQKCKNKIKHDCTPKRLSNSTINKITRTLSATLKHAIDNNKLKDNPVRRVKELPESEPLEEFLTPAQFEAMWRELEPYPQLRDIVQIAIWTGWRQGQILSLKASSLIPETQTVFVIASKQQKARKRPVGDKTWQLLTRLASETKCDWLFYNPQSLDRITKLPKAWNTVRKNAGLGSFRFHSLRAVASTILDRQGFSPFTIQNTLSHARVDTTSGYIRARDAQVREALNALEDDKYLQ